MTRAQKRAARAEQAAVEFAPTSRDCGSCGTYDDDCLSIQHTDGVSCCTDCTHQ